MISRSMSCKIAKSYPKRKANFQDIASVSDVLKKQKALALTQLLVMSFINLLFKVFRNFQYRHMLFRDNDFFICLWVSSYTLRTFHNFKTAKSTQLYVLASFHGINYSVHESIYHGFSFHFGNSRRR